MSSMSATLRLVAVFAVAASEDADSAVAASEDADSLWACVWYAIARGSFCKRVATAMRWRILALLPTFFCSATAATMSSHSPKRTKKFRSRADGRVAAVPCVVLAVFVAASSDRLKSKT